MLTETMIEKELRSVCRKVDILWLVSMIAYVALTFYTLSEPPVSSTVHTSNGTLMHMRPSNVPLATYGHNGRIDAAAYCVGNEVMFVTRSGDVNYVDDENGIPVRCEDFRRMTNATGS